MSMKSVGKFISFEQASNYCKRQGNWFITKEYGYYIVWDMG